jgi:hypothetical protein
VLFDRYDPLLSVALTTASTAILEAFLHLAYSHNLRKVPLDGPRSANAGSTHFALDEAMRARDAVRHL